MTAITHIKCLRSLTSTGEVRYCHSIMMSETEICSRYEAELAVIARLDHICYLSQSPTDGQRRAYVARQMVLTEMREAFYAELAASRLLKRRWLR